MPHSPLRAPLRRILVLDDFGDVAPGAADWSGLPVTFLRQKLEPDPKAPVYIQSMRSVGYRFKPLDRAV